MTYLLLYIIVFILLSGLMAAIDAAVLSVTQPEIEELVHHGRSGAVPLRAVKQRIGRSMVVIVILTNTINVLGPILVSREAIQTYGTDSLLAVTIVLAVGTILFSEIFPKAIGAHYAPLVARLSATPLIVAGTLMFPIVRAIAWVSEKVTSGTRPLGTERQVRALALMGRRAGHIESDEILMIYRVFRLNDRLAGDIMTGREDIVGVSADETIRDAAAKIQRTGYSRYPVYLDSLDNIIGIVTGREILQAILSDRGAEAVSSLTGQILRFDFAERCDDLLIAFRDAHVHLGVVSDGTSTLGIVTLEDVLEELVGEIEDEKD